MKKTIFVFLIMMMIISCVSVFAYPALPVDSDFPYQIVIGCSDGKYRLYNSDKVLTYSERVNYLERSGISYRVYILEDNEWVFSGQSTGTTTYWRMDGTNTIEFCNYTIYYMADSGEPDTTRVFFSLPTVLHRTLQDLHRSLPLHRRIMGVILTMVGLVVGFLICLMAFRKCWDFLRMQLRGS